MKYLKQICLILLFSFLGELLKALLPFPIPASIYGMVLLFGALMLKILPGEAVRDSGAFLTSVLPLLFVAPAVNLIDCWDQIKPVVIPLAALILVTTVLTFGVSGLVTQWLVSRKGEKADE
ncbi:MAG: CidA/LrgA family protein [Oscillospiraceae bacterium]|nr:CidA/LrgA family protein [Oscillospiraceae bacterium]